MQKSAFAASHLDRDSLVEMYKQIFEIAKVQTTEKLNPETYDFTNAGLIDTHNFLRVRMIFDGMIIDRINEEKNRNSRNNFHSKIG